RCVNEAVATVDPGLDHRCPGVVVAGHPVEQSIPVEVDPVTAQAAHPVALGALRPPIVRSRRCEGGRTEAAGPVRVAEALRWQGARAVRARLLDADQAALAGAA